MSTSNTPKTIKKTRRRLWRPEPRLASKKMTLDERLRSIRHTDLFKIAIPIMIANVSTPLIGVLDTIIIG